ncbi:hypothetical protein BC826DRAFT_1036225 [Russula brevipes]|nr:hypothetical protein BC826DRAFT_1036225 [Russula brevipes]
MGRHVGQESSRLFQHNPSLYFGMSLSDSKSHLTLLHTVHISNSLHIIMGLRLQDPVPGWMTHMTRSGSGLASEDWRKNRLRKAEFAYQNPRSIVLRSRVDTQNVNVRYVRLRLSSCN